MELSKITEIEKELKRFQEKLKLCKQRLEKDKYAQYSCRETGALKRAGLDLKQVLTQNLK
jgi:hypothetical protein